MTYSYYPGCSLHSTGSEYDISLKEICKKLEIELKEIKGWVCCGASSAHHTSKLLSIALPIKNLAEVEKEGQNEVVVPCAACFSRFKTAVYEIENDASLAQEINWVIDYPYHHKIKVLHPLEIFKKEDIIKNVVNDLSKFKVVCYYGCLLTRPPKVMKFDICEYPVSMDKLLNYAGIKTLNWSYKTDCCGAAFSLTKTDIVLKLSHSILEEAKAVGAEAVVVACPLCHANLDTRQDEIKELYKIDYEIPILYFTQLLGLAFGIPASSLGLNKHLANTDTFLGVGK